MKHLSFFLILVWAAFLCAGENIYLGDSYRLTLDRGIKLEIIDPDGTSHSLIDSVWFDGHTEQWKPRYRSRDASVKVARNDSTGMDAKLTFQFDGNEAGQMAATAEIIARSGWLHLKFTQTFSGQPESTIRRRILFGFPTGTTNLFRRKGFGALSEFSSDIPFLKSSFSPRSYCDSGTRWEKTQDGKLTSTFEMMLVPYSGEPPKFSGSLLSPENDVIGWGFFTRPFGVFCNPETPQGELVFLNLRDEALQKEYTLEIKDHRGAELLNEPLRLKMLPGGIQRIRRTFPADKQGTFTISAGPLKTGYALIPPGERRWKDRTIFGMQTYIWNPRTPDIMELMAKIGVHFVRQAWSSSPGEENIPLRSKDGSFLPDSVSEWHGKYQRNGLEIIPMQERILRLPPGLFRFSENGNENNIHGLAVSVAEQQKISYVKQKQRDPSIQVGTAGFAGVDLAWLNEFAENGAWNYFDVLFVHLHCFPRAPEVNGTMTSIFWLHDRVVLLRKLMEKYGERPVGDTENGYLVLNPNMRPEQYPLAMVSDYNAAAAYMVRSYLQAMAYGMFAKLWFVLENYGGFGLYENGRPLPGLAAYAAMTAMLDGAEYIGELSSVDSPNDASDRETFIRSWFGQATEGEEKLLETGHGAVLPDIPDLSLKPIPFIRAFRDPAGKPILACWATLTRQRVVSQRVPASAWKGQMPGKSILWNGSVLNTEPEPIPISIPVGVPEVIVCDMMGNARMESCHGGILHLKLSDEPQFIFGASPAILDEAAGHSLTIFRKPGRTAAPNLWHPLIQCILPESKTFPKRKSVYDRENIAMNFTAGEEHSVFVRLTNLSSGTQKGTVRLELPEEWSCTPESVGYEIPAGTERQIVAEFKIKAKNSSAPVKLRSIVDSEEFGRIADSVMNVTVMP